VYKRQAHTGTYSRKFTADSQFDGIVGDAFSITEGKQYRVKAWVYGDGTNALRVQVAGTSTYTLEISTIYPASWTEIDEIITATATSTDEQIKFISSSGISSGTWYIDDVSIVALGAVALYTQDSISETTWYDKANGNDGAVTGASVLNDADSIPDTFSWHFGAFNFTSSNNDADGGVTVVGGSAHPTLANDIIFGAVNVPSLLNGKKIVLDQITVYYGTDASGDDFDFSLVRTDQDGSVTTDASEADIGNGGTGDASETILASDLTLSDFAYYVRIDVNNTDTATDVKIHDIKFSGHLA
jgi:hypothetical protein